MNPGPFRLSVAQASWMVFYLTVCVTPFSFSDFAVRSMGRWAWASMLPAIVVGLFGLGAVVVLRRRRPNASVLEYAPEFMGRVGGWAYIFMLCLLFVTGAGANLHVFVDMLHTTLLPNLSEWWPSIAMAALAGYVAFFGPEVITRAGEMLLVAVLPGLAGVLTLPWLNSVPGRLLPLTRVPWDKLFTNVQTASIISACRGFLPLLVLAPMIQGRQMVGRTTAALLAGAMVIMVSFAIPIAVLGPDLAALFRFPLLDSIGTVAWTWLPFQRLGHLAALLWEGVTFVVVATYLWLGAALGGWLFLRGGWRPMVFAAAVVTLLLASPVLDSEVQKKLLTIWTVGVVALGAAVPVCLAIAAFRRREKA